MESNLATPFNPIPSVPHDARLVFYSFQSDDLLFSGQKEIVIYCQAGLRCVGLSWTLARNLFKKPFLAGDAEALPTNRFVIRIPADELKPGFFDLRVVLDAGDGKSVPGICTFGFRAGEMLITPPTSRSITRRSGTEGKQELAKILADAQSSAFQEFKGKEIDAYNLASAALPGDYDPQGHRTERVQSAKISFAGVGGIRVHGWLAKPVGEGPFPRNARPAWRWLCGPPPTARARSSRLCRARLQIHGQDVDLPSYPQLPGYYADYIYEPPQAFYYYRGLSELHSGD